MTSTNVNDDPNVQKIAMVGVIGVIVLFALIVGLQTLFYNVETAEREIKFGAGDPLELARLRTEQLEKLHAYRWIDKSKGIVGIPIDLGMELTVREAGELVEPEPTSAEEQP
jgi:hypothetical protein